MFCIHLPLKYKVEAVLWCKLEPLCNASVNVHTPLKPCDHADGQRTITQELPQETPTPTTQRGRPCTHLILHCSDAESPAQCRYPLLMEVPSPTGKIWEYLEVQQDKLATERDTLVTNVIAGPTTNPGNASASTPSAHKTSKLALFHKVLVTSKLAHQSYAKIEQKLAQHNYEDGCARLVVESTTYKQAMRILGAIGNLVITSNNRGEYMSCKGYSTEITISGRIAYCITAWEMDNING